MLKNILIITFTLLTLGFFMPNPTFACGNSPANPEDCNTSLNQDLPITVTAKDEDGNIIAGVEINFNWSIDPTPPNNLNLGFFVGGDSTWPDLGKIDGKSTAILKIGSYTYSPSSPAIVRVSVTYGGDTVVKVFQISTSCGDTPPLLYYGIASVSESGADTWQSSTAEVLETCRTEYKLYEGIGEGG